MNGEEHQYQKYSEACNLAKKGIIDYGWKSSFFFGLFFAGIFISYAFSFLIGSWFIYFKVYNHNQSKDYNVGSILTIFFAVTTGIFGFNTLSPVMKSI